MDTLRAFVGSLLDLGTTRRVLDLQRSVRRNAEARGARVTWVPPANLHITLRFLGEIDAGLAPALGDALALVGKAQSAPRVSVRGLGAFPLASEAPGPPRVLYARIDEGGEAVAELARAVERACEELGFARSEARFNPHVTLGRVRDWPEGLALDELAPRGGEARVLDCGSSYLTELALYRSDRLRTGVEYAALAKHTLTGAAPARSSARKGTMDRK